MCSRWFKSVVVMLNFGINLMAQGLGGLAVFQDSLNPRASLIKRSLLLLLLCLLHSRLVNKPPPPPHSSFASHSLLVHLLLIEKPAKRARHAKQVRIAHIHLSVEIQPRLWLGCWARLSRSQVPFVSSSLRGFFSPWPRSSSSSSPSLRRFLLASPPSPALANDDSASAPDPASPAGFRGFGAGAVRSKSSFVSEIFSTTMPARDPGMSTFGPGAQYNTTMSKARERRGGGA